MKQNEILTLAAVGVGLYLMSKKPVSGIAGVNDKQLWNIERIKKNLGRLLIEYRELRDYSIEKVNKADMHYSGGMHYVINQIFTDVEQFKALETQY